MRMPEDMCAMVCSRSGLAAKKGIFVSNSPGILDADYRGEIKVILHNLSHSPFSVKPGDRVAQMVFHKVERTNLNIVDTFYTDDTDRGTGGLGSTGGIS
jgi:dUTP pyrophosphatase